MATRTPAQIIGNDRVLQLIFEGYAIVPAKLTDTMRERMATIADGLLLTYDEYWRDMLQTAEAETALNQ